jgi:hypothetical protein
MSSFNGSAANLNLRRASKHDTQHNETQHNNIQWNDTQQGTLTEGEGSVQLTSMY